jgi:hypothetical protein
MSRQWETAKHCHTALSFLLLNIQRQNPQQDTYIPYDFASETHSPIASDVPSMSQDENIERSKRPKLDISDSYTGAEPIAADLTIRHSAPSTVEMNGPSENPLDPTASGFNTRSPGTGRPNPQSTYPASSSREFLAGPSHFRLPIYETPDNIHQLHYSPLPMLSLDRLEDPQWPGGSTITTNFDLNMTDLFQGASWDPSLFDAFSHGQVPVQQMQPQQPPHQEQHNHHHQRPPNF